MTDDARRMKVRTFITNDDALTLQACCDRAGVPMIIGGDPTGITGRIDGFERQLEDGMKGRADWMVVYLCPVSEGELYALRTMFLDMANMQPDPRTNTIAPGKAKP